MLNFTADSQKYLSEGVYQRGLTLHGQHSPSPEQIPFSFCWLNVSLHSFLYLHCHCWEFAFMLILSVSGCTMSEKPEVLQFVIICFLPDTLSKSRSSGMHISLCSLLSYIWTTDPCYQLTRCLLNSCVAGNTLWNWGELNTVNCFIL